MPLSPDSLNRILNKAILAPSGDNIQPWRFRKTADGVELRLDFNREEHFFEAGLRSLYFSAGAVIENIRVAAAREGLRLDCRYFPNDADRLFVAAIRFIDGEDASVRYFDALEKRCTNRKFYQSNRSIAPAIYDELSQIARDQSGYQMIWAKKGQSSHRELTRLIGLADMIRFENAKIAKEFINLLRYSRQDVETYRDRFDVRTFENPMAGLIFKLMKNWKLAQILNRLGLSKSFDLYARMQLAGSQAIGAVVARGYAPLDYVKGGEVMQRIWHALTLHGLSLQPMEALPIYVANLQVNDGKYFTADQREKALRYKSDLARILGYPEDSGVIFLFRMGYAPPPSARSLRRPLESFLD